MKYVKISLFIVVLFSCFIYADSGGESIAEPFFFDTGWIYNQRIGHFHFAVEDECGVFDSLDDLVVENKELNKCNDDLIAYFLENDMPENEPLRNGFIKEDLLFSYMFEKTEIIVGDSVQNICCNEGDDLCLQGYQNENSYHYSFWKDDHIDGFGRFDFFIAEGTSIPDIEIVSCVASGGAFFGLSRDILFDTKDIVSIDEKNSFSRRDGFEPTNPFYESDIPVPGNLGVLNHNAISLNRKEITDEEYKEYNNMCPIAVFTTNPKKYEEICPYIDILEYPEKEGKITGDYHLYIRPDSYRFSSRLYTRCLLKVIDSQENSVQNGMPLINFRAHGAFDNDDSMNKAVLEWEGTDVKKGTAITSENYPGSYADYFNRKFLFRKEGDKVLEPSEGEYEEFALSEKGETMWLDGIWYPRNPRETFKENFSIDFDWRNVDDVNWMTSVKNQGSCGSCWAFSALSAMEGSYNVQMNNPDLDLDLAEQELVSSCFPNGNCVGIIEVWPIFDYLKETGIATESCIPYLSESDTLCESHNCETKYGLKESININDIESMKNYLREKGPLSVCFKLSSVYYDRNNIIRCNEEVDPIAGHCVTISGYSDEGEFWIVKNSWGVDWSDNGYGKIGYGECYIEGVSPEFFPTSLVI